MVRWVAIGVMIVVVAGRYWRWRSLRVGVVEGERVKIAAVTDWGGGVEAEGLRVGSLGAFGVGPRDRVEVVGTVGKGRRVKAEEVRLVGRVGGWERWLLQVRARLVGGWKRWLPESEAGLMAGIVWGEEDLLPWRDRERMRDAGISHIVVVSGYNVTMVAGWLVAVLPAWVGRRWAELVAAAAVGWYVLVAGLGPPGVRAGIMAVLTMIGLSWGRKSDSGWLLVWSVGMMLVWEPGWLESVSFQLSVAATAGIILAGGGGGGYVRETVKTTGAVFIFTLPVVLYHFGEVAAMAPLVNLAVLWAVPVVMQIGMVASLAGGVWEWAGSVVAVLAWPFLHWVLWVCRQVEAWGWGQWQVGGMGWEWVAGYYLALVILVRLVKLRR